MGLGTFSIYHAYNSKVFLISDILIIFMENSKADKNEFRRNNMNFWIALLPVICMNASLKIKNVIRVIMLSHFQEYLCQTT